MAKKSTAAAKNLSRRSFLRLTVGSLTFLPTVASIAALPPEAVLATEGTPRAQLASGSTIYIVSPRELGIVMRDVSVEDGSANLVTGAHVKISSRFNGAVAEGTTDEAGALSLDISGLAEDEGKQQMLARYDFDATIEVSAPGYREFRTALIRVEGGTTLGVPTQPAQSGIPYPVSASFDEWDVLYSAGDAATFVSSPANSMTHVLGVSLLDCPAGAAVAAELYCDGAQVSQASVTADAAGTADLSFQGAFLKSDGSSALPIGEDRAYAVRYTAGTTTYEVPIKLGVCEAPPDAPDPQLKKDLSLMPFNADGFKMGFDIPKSWPLIGGDKLRLWEPQFPLWGSFDPFGFLRFRITSPEFGYAKVAGKPDKSGWQRVPRNAVKKQFADAWKAMEDQTMDTFDSMTRLNKDDKRDTFRQTNLASKFTFMVQVEALAMATWDWGGKESRGRAQLGVRAGANYSLQETFWAGPFPVVIRFGIGLNLSASGQLGFIGEHVWTPWDWRWDYNSVGFELQICFPPTLSVGVGIAGVASISARGAVTVTFNLHYGPIPSGFPDKENPHLRLAASVGLHVDVEALFFTYTHKITGADWPDWYDSWADKDALAASADDALEDLKTAQPLNQLNEGKIITAGSLGRLAEFATDGLASAGLQEHVMTSYTLFEHTADGDVPLAQMYLDESQLVGLTSQGDVAVEDAAAEGQAAVAVADSETGTPEAAAASQAPASEPAAAAAAVAPATASEAEPLSAQADAEPSYILRPSNDQSAQIPYIVTQEVSATPVGDHDYVAVDEAPGVLRLGLEQGFRPTTDIRMASNILSSSHLRCFTVGDSDYIARIGVVLVAGQPRTRIICETATGTDRRIIDFASGYRDDECFDYDFDIAATTVGGEEVVNLVVISGKRPADDATSFAQAASETFFSFVSCTDWFGSRVFTGLTVMGSSIDPFDGSTFFTYHSYSCPRLVQIKGTKNGVEYGQAAVAVLVRASHFEDEIMGTDPDLTRAGVGFVFFADGDRAVDTTSMAPMRQLTTKLIDPTITDIALSGRADGYQLLELKGSEKTHCVLLETDPCRWVVDERRAIPYLYGTQVIDLGEYEGKVSRLIPMESGSYFLACVDGLLKRADVVADAGGASLAFSDIDGAELNLSDFGVLEGGDVLYWPASRENGGYTFDDEAGEPRLREEDGALNLIMGARIVGGKLSRAFALCEVDHTMSRIRHFGASSDHMSFISSSTVDLETGQGEQWFTSVPWVRCANLLEVQPYSTMLAKGDQLPFYVALRNDGNCYLSGVELTVAEVDGDPIGSMRLDFGEDTLMGSEWNPPNEDGTLQNVEDDWALAPGTTSRYLASYVTIPEDWQGAKEIEVYVSAVYGAPVLAAEGMLAQAEDSSMVFLPDHSVKSTVHLPSSLLQSDGSEETELTRADVRVVSQGSQDGSKGTGGTSGNGGYAKDIGSSAAANKGSLPKTGDPGDGLARGVALGAAAGLAGIAAGALLRRRGRLADAPCGKDVSGQE